MKFGFCLMSDATEIGFFNHVEALGYSSVWVADSQMLFSDCYAVLALAARQTSRLRIGPGTAICGTRIAPVQAAAMATINALAPGRVFLGTGNTAMRTMGQKPMKMAEYSEYLRVLAALLRAGWTIKRQRGSHRLLTKPGWSDYTFAYHDRAELGRGALILLAKKTGLRPSDL